MHNYSIIILVTEGIELKYIKDNDLAMSNKNFTLTYDELLLLLKDAYRNGYATYEMTAAGLEPYDDDGYARWVLLGMEKNKQEELDNTDKKLHISDVMRSLFLKCLDECYTEANIDGYHGNDNKEYVINEILQKYFS